MARIRGSAIQPANRFERLHVEPDVEQLEVDDAPLPDPRTEFLPDDSRSIVSENASPDVGFRFSLNPYRGCEHGCAYCYARPTHEYLGFSAGLDFETKILVKHRAAELFRDWLARDAWRPEPIAFSGVTDCYQPAERRFRLTRACLAVAAESCQPISIVTKNALLLRDLDLLTVLAEHHAVHVSLSLTTLDAELARAMEPRTSTPAARLRAMAELAGAGIPTRVMVAPVVPGLTDNEIPSILGAAAEAGATSAHWIMLRLPSTVEPVFRNWLARTQPTRAAKVESLIRAVRGGKLNDATFGQRMRGAGPIAEQIERTFEVFARRHGLNEPLPPLDTSHFQPPTPRSGQRRLF